MSAGNVNLAINVKTNMNSSLKQVQAMASGMQKLQAEQNKLQQDALKNGQYNPVQYDTFQQNVIATRKRYSELMDVSNEFAVATRNITSETASFNKALSQQKIGLGDIVRRHKMVGQAMREQMALSQMTVTQWKKDALGRISADLYIPKNVDTKSFSAIRQQLGYAGELLRSVSTQTINWGKNFQWTGRQLTVGISVPLSIAAGAMAKFGMEADKQLVRIAKVYGDTEGAFQTTNESIRDMAQDTAKYVAEQYGIAATETRNVMAELAATGLEGNQLQSMTSQVMRTSFLGEMSSEDSLKLVRVLKEVYGYSSQEMEKQMNYFNAIENSTALTMQDVTEGLPRIAGIMQATGVSIQEQTELLVAFKAAGIDVAEGANALKSINFKAVAATPTSAKAFFEITGVEMQSLIDKTNGEFLPMMQEIANVMSGLSDNDQVNLIARVFGIHQGGRTLTLLRQLTDGSEGMLRAQNTALKSEAELAAMADKEVATAQASISARFNNMIQTIRVNMEQMGQPIMEALLPIGEAIANVINWFNNLSDETKNFAMRAALVTGAVGPMVMLIGLFANFVGVAGRAASSVLSLLGNFKVLNPATRAAELLQEKFGTSTQKQTAAVKNYTIAVDQLVNAINAYNNQMTSASTQQFKAPTPLNVANSSHKIVTDANGVKTRVPNTTNNVQAVNTEVSRHNQLVEEGKAKWVGMSGAIGGVALGVAGVADLTGNQMLGNISMVAMSISAIAPLMGTLSGRVAETYRKMGDSNRAFSAKMGKQISAGMEVGKKALAGLATFATGPWGIAMAGALALVMWRWDKHRKQVEQTRKDYLGLANTAETLADAYGFQALTPLEKEREIPGYDPLTNRGQLDRIDELKSKQTDYYNSLIAFKNKVSRLDDEATRKQQILNQALSQGVQALQSGANSETAKRIVWDAYRVMADEWISYEEFMVKFKIDGQSIDRLLEDADAAGTAAAQAFNDAMAIGKANISTAWWRGAEFTEEDKASIEAETIKAWNAIQAIQDPKKRAEAMSSVFGEYLKPMYEEYTRGLQNGFIKEGTTFTEFLKTYGDSARKAQLKVYEGYHMFEGMTEEQILQNELVAQSIAGVGETALNSAAKTGTFWDALTGNHDEIDQLIDDQEKLKSAMSVLADPKATSQQKANATQWLGQARSAVVESGKLDDAQRKAAGSAKELGEEGENAGKSLVDGYENAAKAADELSDSQREAVDIHKNVMTERQNRLVDFYVKQFDAYQDAQRDDFDAKAQDRLDDIDRRYDGLEKKAEDLAKQREKDLEKRQEAEMNRLEQQQEDAERALERKHEREEKALEARQDALQERQDRESDALSDRHDAQTESLEKQQEARRKSIEDAAQAQIDAINKQIEKERELEKVRQELIEKEKERISRLQQMFSQNIDLNMAVNSGDLDEAAKIAANMNAQQETWAQDDLSKITSDASNERIKKMEGQIDAIEADKEKRLEALAVVEEAQKKALQAQQEREKKALEDKFKRMEAELAAEKEKLSRLQQAESESLTARFERQKTHLSDLHQVQNEKLQQAIDADKAALDIQRENERIAEEATTETNRQNLETRLANQKATFDQEAEHYRQMIATNETDFKAGNDAMYNEFSKHHMPNMRKANSKEIGNILRDTDEMYQQQIDVMGNEKTWNSLAVDIATAMMDATVGGRFSISDFRKFLKTGQLPKDSRVSGIGSTTVSSRATGGTSSTSAGQVQRAGMTRTMYHSGGIAGVTPSSPTGPGFKGRSQEIDATLLKGEGVLNLRAMNMPGMPQLLNALNSGKALTAQQPSAAEKRARRPGPMMGDGMGAIPAVFGALAPALSIFGTRMAQVLAVTGLEAGVNKMAASYSGSGEQIAGVNLDSEQMQNASAIIRAGKRLGASERDIIIALMAAMQESSMRNLGHGDDIYGVRNPDGTLTSSLGLFQQQNWWGSREDRLNPERAAEIFFNALFRISDRNQMGLGAAAQRVQGSAHPTAYNKWESLARSLVDAGGASGLNGSQINTQKSIFDRMKLVKELSSMSFEEGNVPAGNYNLTGTNVAHPSGGQVTGWSYYPGAKGWRPDTPNDTWPMIWEVVRRAVPEAIKTSDARYNTFYTASGYQSMHSVGRAIDFVVPGGPEAWKAAFNAIYNLRKWSQLLYSPMGTRQIGYRDGTVDATHYDHIHVGYKNGGLVPGRGFGDVVKTAVEPGEFIVRKSMAKKHYTLLDAMNKNQVDFAPNVNALNHANANARFLRNVDSANRTEYNINIEFTGPVNSDVDVEKVVKRVLHRNERTKANSTYVGTR